MNDHNHGNSTHDYQIGRLQGRVDTIETQHAQFEARMETRLSSIDQKLDALVGSWMAGKGAWKLISVLAVIVVFGSSLAMWAISEYREGEAAEIIQTQIERSQD